MTHPVIASALQQAERRRLMDPTADDPRLDLRARIWLNENARDRLTGEIDLTLLHGGIARLLRQIDDLEALPSEDGLLPA